MSTLTQSLPDTAAADSPSTWRLREITLVDCSATTGEDGDRTRPKAVKHEGFTVEATYSNGILAYHVETTFEFLDEDDDLVAEFAMAYHAVYSVGELAPAEDDVDEFRKSVILQVAPFIRELVVSLTAKMNLPKFFMPLLRRTEFEIVRAEDETTAKEAAVVP